jgi:hypothetical protein
MLVACTHTEKWSMTLHKSVVNATDKELYYEVKTDEGIENRSIHAFDSITVTFYKEHYAESSVLASTVRQNRIKIEQETVFNLTDTSRYEYNLKYERSPQQGTTEEEKIFAQRLTWTLGNTSTDENAIIIIKLHVTESILQIMQKDYSMLDRFKEYYGR